MKTFIEKRIFLINIFFRMLLPPIYSFERLERYCKERIEKNPKSYLPRWFLAGLYKDFKKNEAAKKEYQEIKKMGYMTPKDSLSLGEVLFRLEDYHGVIETISPIIHKYPKHKNANWHLGRSYMKIGECQKAAIYLERVILSGSKRYEDYWHLGDCYHYIGQFEKARAQYSKALSLKPDSQRLKENIASIDSRLRQKR